MATTKEETQEAVYNTPDSISDADERELAAIGKKSVLRVRTPSPIHSHSFRPLPFWDPNPRKLIIPTAAQLLAPRHPRPLYHSRHNMGGSLLSFRFRPIERRTRRAHIRVSFLLGGVGSGGGDDGRAGEHVAHGRWSVSLDV